VDDHDREALVDCLLTTDERRATWNAFRDVDRERLLEWIEYGGSRHRDQRIREAQQVVDDGWSASGFMVGINGA
jgi:hypothetical protein